MNSPGVTDNWTNWPPLCLLKLYLSSGVNLNDYIYFHAAILGYVTFSELKKKKKIEKKIGLPLAQWTQAGILKRLY